MVLETKFNSRISHSEHVWLAQLDKQQTFKLVMVSVASSIPTGGNFIFLLQLFKTPFVQKCQNVRFVLFRKQSTEKYIPPFRGIDTSSLQFDHESDLNSLNRT